jgi:hypothetical protein
MPIHAKAINKTKTTMAIDSRFCERFLLSKKVSLFVMRSWFITSSGKKKNVMDRRVIRFLMSIRDEEKRKNFPKKPASKAREKQ